MPNSSKKLPNPSTYRQIIENMQEIVKLADLVGDVDVTEIPYTIKEMADKIKELNDKVLEPVQGGDIINTDEGMKILGIHSNTENVDTNLTVDQYQQGFTLEIKSVEAIGLKGKTGMNSPYCFVMTMVQDSSIPGEVVGTLDYKPMQVAFANNAMYLYCRYGNSDNSWGAWNEREEQEIRPQIVDSVTEPVNQLEGEYWCEPITDTSTTTTAET